MQTIRHGGIVEKTEQKLFNKSTTIKPSGKRLITGSEKHVGKKQRMKGHRKVTSQFTKRFKSK